MALLQVEQLAEPSAPGDQMNIMAHRTDWPPGLLASWYALLGSTQYHFCDIPAKNPLPGSYITVRKHLRNPGLRESYKITNLFQKKMSRAEEEKERQSDWIKLDWGSTKAQRDMRSQVGSWIKGELRCSYPHGLCLWDDTDRESCFGIDFGTVFLIKRRHFFPLSGKSECRFFLHTALKLLTFDRRCFVYAFIGWYWNYKIGPSYLRSLIFFFFWSWMNFIQLVLLLIPHWSFNRYDSHIDPHASLCGNPS